MKKLLLLFFLTGTVVMMVIMARTGAPLKTAQTPLGILDLEFAYNSSRVNTVLKAWQETARESCGKICAARFNTYLDFIFIIFYSIFLFLACNKIAADIRGPVAKAGNFMAGCSLVAGFFDVMENAGMLLTLNGHSSGTIAFLTSFFSVIKWCLALVAVLYLVTGLLVWIYYKLWNPNP